MLVIDNREQVARNVERGLRAAGYAVAVVSGDSFTLHADALAVAQNFRPHVAIVDLRLTDDADTSDTSGMALLRELKRRCGGIQLIAYSGYLNPSVDHELSTLGVNWVDKSDAPQVLKERVGELAKAASAPHRAFVVRWPARGDLGQRVRELFGAEVPVSLLDDLVAQLFARFRRVSIEPIGGRWAALAGAVAVSRGHSLVLEVQPPGAAARKVLKLADPRRVVRETRNYARYIQDRTPGQFHTILEASRTFWDVGGSVYSLLSDSQAHALRTFGAFYRETEDTDALLRPLRRFCLEAWRANYQRQTQGEQHTLFDDYDKRLHLRRKLTQLAETPPPRPPLAAALPDPVQWVLDHLDDAALRAPVRAVVHGDFHGDNLFTNGEALWVVDFERTGIGPIFADFCELEIDVVTRLLPAAVGDEEFLDAGHAAGGLRQSGRGRGWAARCQLARPIASSTGCAHSPGKRRDVRIARRTGGGCCAMRCLCWGCGCKGGMWQSKGGSRGGRGCMGERWSIITSTNPAAARVLDFPCLRLALRWAILCPKE